MSTINVLFDSMFNIYFLKTTSPHKDNKDSKNIAVPP